MEGYTELGGCCGCFVGAFVGFALAIGLFFTCLTGPGSASRLDVFFALEILVIVIGAVTGVFIGIKITREGFRTAAKPLTTVEEAARTHFIPSTRQTLEPQPETGIKPEGKSHVQKPESKNDTAQ